MLGRWWPQFGGRCGTPQGRRRAPLVGSACSRPCNAFPVQAHSSHTTCVCASNYSAPLWLINFFFFYPKDAQRNFNEPKEKTCARNNIFALTFRRITWRHTLIIKSYISSSPRETGGVRGGGLYTISEINEPLCQCVQELSQYRVLSADWKSFVCARTYPHPPVWCVRARCRDPRAGRAGRSPGGARSRGCDRTGIPAGGRTWTPRRRTARRAGGVRRRATRGPGNGCGTGRARAAGVRGSRGRRTPRRQIWTDPAELKCLI